MTRVSPIGPRAFACGYHGHSNGTARDPDPIPLLVAPNAVNFIAQPPRSVTVPLQNPIEFVASTDGWIFRKPTAPRWAHGSAVGFSNLTNNCKT
jgi:hypothetical protein